MQYTYDSLARLTKAETVGPGWGQAFGYDDWGNLYSKSVTKGSAPTLSVAIDGWTNRITGAGFGYDGAGNMTSMPVAGGTQTLTYDHQNRVATMTNPSGTENYNYDLLNRRMLRTRGSTTDIFFYGAMGELLGRYRAKQFTHAVNGMTIAGPQCEEMYFYFAGRRVAKRAGSASLGGWGGASYAWIQRQQGDRAESVGDGSTYYPYGEEKTATANDTHKFATYYRDAGSGLDYAHNRYYSPVYGRFTSPDPSKQSINPANPLSWNRYTYVVGDPVNRNDPSGLCDVFLAGITMEASSHNAGINTFVNDVGAIDAYPFSNGAIDQFEDIANGIASVLHQAKEADEATRVAIVAIMTASFDPGQINIFAFSGGAAAFNAALTYLPENVRSRIGNVTYMSPGTGQDTLAGGTGTTTFVLATTLSLTRLSAHPVLKDPVSFEQLADTTPTVTFRKRIRS